MQVVHDRCCGLDVHKKRLSACLLVRDPPRTRHKEVRSFGTTTPDLLQLRAWLTDVGCTHIAMESTGSYWKPVYNLLEDAFALVLANAQHIKALPGRKTDVGDAEWIADLLQHGLIRASFIPPKPLRELRELTRYRKSLIQERSAEVNRLQKVLEGANIKLASVATSVMGQSGQLILAALVDGVTDAEVLANLALGKLRRKLPDLEQALVGNMGPHQRFVLRQQLAHIHALDDMIEQCSIEIAMRFAPLDETIARICTIPGVGRRTAETVLAEIGWEMDRFLTANHLASWAGVCPGNHESAGKRTSGKTRKGSRWLHEALVEAARAAARTRHTYLAAQYHRLAARRGGNKAAVAVAHTILIIIYHLLQDGGVYQDLGATYFDDIDRERVQRRLIRRLEAMGCQVQVTLSSTT